METDNCCHGNTLEQRFVINITHNKCRDGQSHFEKGRSAINFISAERAGRDQSIGSTF